MPIKQTMLNEGIIEKSSSEWASPLVLVRKPSGDLRICVDYRKLNEVTAVTSYPLPNITETIDRLAGALYFTSIDMTSGYHQVEIAEEDKDKTAFISPYRLYQYSVWNCWGTRNISISNRGYGAGTGYRGHNGIFG